MNTRPDFSLNPMAALVVAYNLCAAELERPSVNKFSDKATAVKRLSAILDDVEAAGLSVSYMPNGAIEDIVRTDSISPDLSIDKETGAVTSPTPEVVQVTVPSGVVEKEPASLSTLDLSHRIQVLVDNPKRKGSRSHTIWTVYRTGMTGEKYVAEMVRLGYGRRLALSSLHWDLDKGFIYLGADVTEE